MRRPSAGRGLVSGNLGVGACADWGSRSLKVGPLCAKPFGGVVHGPRASAGLGFGLKGVRVPAGNGPCNDHWVRQPTIAWLLGLGGMGGHPGRAGGYRVFGGVTSALG